MQHRVSIWRNRDQLNEMHQTIFLDNLDYKRLQDIVVTYKLPIAEAYNKLLAEKKQKND